MKRILDLSQISKSRVCLIGCLLSLCSQWSCRQWFIKLIFEKIQSLPTYDKPKLISFDDYSDDMDMKIQFNSKGDEDIEQKIWQKQNKEIFAKRFKVTNISIYTHKRKRKLEYQKILKDQVRSKQQPPKKKELVDESLQKKP
ncbi:hypothetical protein pb186bvf_005365 [Paramecium bursaria]